MSPVYHYSDDSPQQRAARVSAAARRQRVAERRDRIVRVIERGGPMIAPALELVLCPRWCTPATLRRDLAELVRAGRLERRAPAGAYAVVPELELGDADPLPDSARRWNP